MRWANVHWLPVKESAASKVPEGGLTWTKDKFATNLAQIPLFTDGKGIFETRTSVQLWG
jgi:hypothetical protein